MAHRCLTLFTVIVISCIYEAGGVVEVQKLPGWSPWSGWTSCSVTCGYGDSFRQAHWLDKDGQRPAVLWRSRSCPDGARGPAGRRAR
uniref:Uncharacterized protein n=1 Tax=Magallana gigas TaxID=29159 RepID=K1QAL7_MAGGI